MAAMTSFHTTKCYHLVSEHEPSMQQRKSVPDFSVHLYRTFFVKFLLLLPLFGFKKGVSCNFAIYTVRQIVHKFVDGGCTVNLCSIDLSKAFDKVNHCALFLKLM